MSRERDHERRTPVFDRDELRQLVEAGPMSRYADFLMASARPAADLRSTRTDDSSIPVGASKFAGSPDVPIGFEWPTKEKRPLAFLAQINFQQIPALGGGVAPPDGLGTLLFFYDLEEQPWGFDPKHAGGWRVIHVPPDTAIKRYEPPPGTFADQMHSSVVDARPSLSLKWHTPHDIPELGDDTPDDHWEHMDELIKSVHGADPLWVHDMSRVFGYPDVRQSPMEGECQLASNGINCGSSLLFIDSIRAKFLEKGVKDWQLLAQFGSVQDGPGWEWADVGYLYFWIRRQELEELDFDNVWLCLQC